MGVSRSESHKKEIKSKMRKKKQQYNQQYKRGKKNSQGYKGVRMRKWGKWVSEIRIIRSISNKRIWLGTYDAPEKAARAYDAALYCLRSKCLKFNFPSLIKTYMKPLAEDQRSALSYKEIKTIAKRYALSTIEVQPNNQNNQDTLIQPSPPVEKSNEMLLPSTNNTTIDDMDEQCYSPESYLIRNIADIWNL